MIIKRGSMRFTISVLFIILIAVTFGITGYLVFSGWRASADNFVARMEKDTESDILKQVESFMHEPLHTNEANHYLLENKIVDLYNRKEREIFFAGIIKSSQEHVYSFTYGMENGEYYGARRNKQNELEVYENNEDTNGRTFYYSVTKDLTSDEPVEETEKFDPRTRDWYKIVKEKQKPAFSAIYKHFVMDDLAVTAGYPIYNSKGVMEGVLATHITLSKINTYLKETVREKNAITYIIEKDSGELVANSLDEPNFRTLKDNRVERIKIEEADNKNIVEAYRRYLISSKNKFILKSDKDKLHITMTDYEKEGLNWLIITAIPQSHYASEITRSIRISLLLSIVALVIAVLVYIKSTKIILKPIYNLINNTEKFSSGNLLERADIIRDDEIGKLSRAFNRMAEQLYILINNLEEKVKERTSELEKANIILKENEGNILYLSYHDQLTGLYNRRYFEEALKRLNNESCLPLSIIIADMNGLKLINDSLGHAVGDEFLKKTAEIIKRGCRKDDIVARLGGDEFIILLPKTESYEVEQILKRINDIASIESVNSMSISISFGYETRSSYEEKIEGVLKKAEDKMYKKKLFDSPSMRGKTISAIISTLSEKSKREEAHYKRVSEICKSIGEALGLPAGDIDELKSLGLLHDIGKIAIEDKILSKTSKLTEEEWEQIKLHPEIGYRILSTVNDMAEMAEYVLAHHERWDGKGYPRGLKGEEIPLQSRIIAIADAYEAMTSERNHRSALSEEEVVRELQKNAGLQFDPELVKVFIQKLMQGR